MGHAAGQCPRQPIVCRNLEGTRCGEHPLTASAATTPPSAAADRTGNAVVGEGLRPSREGTLAFLRALAMLVLRLCAGLSHILRRLIAELLAAFQRLQTFLHRLLIDATVRGLHRCQITRAVGPHNLLMIAHGTMFVIVGVGF